MYSIIDSEQWFSQDISPYKLKKGEFDVSQPYFRSKDQPVTKKLKTTHTPSKTDIETKSRHEQLRPLIMSRLDALQAEWPKKDSETPTNDLLSDEKNMIDFPSMQAMVEAAYIKFSDNNQEDLLLPYVFEEPVTKELDLFSVFHTVCVNRSKTETKLLQLTPEASYLIPPDSTFLMGSLENTIASLGSYIKELGGADLIVMDPPWPNKSVHRSSRYETQDIYDLFRVPIAEMMTIDKQDTLVAIWVTNKPKFRHFILNKLLPAWQLECVGEWVWLKMTTQAEPIFPLDSEHKKPYEQLILARPKHFKGDRVPVPESHIITSIPSKRHSRKPPLEDVLSKFITKKDPVKVELFARCLLPGWVSWGNECLKFQHLDYFDKTL